MTVYDVRVVQTTAQAPPGEMWHLSLHQEPGGSPQDKDWNGGVFRMDGMPRAKTIHLLRRLARRLEEGSNISDVVMP